MEFPSIEEEEKGGSIMANNIENINNHIQHWLHISNRKIKLCQSLYLRYFNQ